MYARPQRIDFQECIKDSPQFRSDIEDAEADLDLLETKLERVIKLCNAMVDTGKSHSTANTHFVTSVTDLLAFTAGDQMFSGTLRKSAAFLLEVQKFYSILLDQARRSVISNLRQFISSDIKTLKTAQRDFTRFSDEMEAAMAKHAQVPKAKPLECEEAQNMMLASRSRFIHTALDYSYQLNILENKKRHDIQQTLLSYVNAQKTFYHQGNDLCVDLEDYFKDLAEKLAALDKECTQLTKRMENRHALVQEANELAAVGTGDPSEKHCGYLYKKTSKGFKTWNRRWFFLKDNQLLYMKRLRDGFTVMEEDMRLCNVKPVMEGERRFCFEIKSPTRSHLLQALSEEECKRWVEAIQAAILAAYRDRSKSSSDEVMGAPEEEGGDSGASSTSAEHLPETGQNHTNVSANSTAPPPASKPGKPRSQVALVQSFPGNDRCCDCMSSDPRWASTNLGITLCIECSGIHRSLGVHVSKVRSLTLDTWEPEVLKVMSELGNTAVNLTYASNVPESVERPHPDSDRSAREQWVIAKYVARAYLKPMMPTGNAQALSGDQQKSGPKWTVARRLRRRAVTRSVTKGDAEGSTPSTEDANILMFGASVLQLPACESTLELEDSDISSQEEDSQSHTSLEGLDQLNADRLLYRGAEARNIPAMMEALANRADINWVNPADTGKTPLMKAVESGSLAASEFLLLNRAKVDAVDAQGRSALHHATRKGHTGQVCQLVKRGANHRLLDVEGVDVIALAIKAEHADIVTLLRVGQLREEMTDADPGVVTDDLFNDVFRDYTNMASTEPDKLKRTMAPVD